MSSGLPLARHLVHVSLLWEILREVLVVFGLLEDVLSEQPFVVRDVNHLDVIAVYAREILGRKQKTYNWRVPLIRSFRK